MYQPNHHFIPTLAAATFVIILFIEHLMKLSLVHILLVSQLPYVPYKNHIQYKYGTFRICTWYLPGT